ncbi:PEP-CTERM sorting domain-containing protein [Limnoglobus roseus]|uniref:PEP-CTERM sorting domain-containing protein n=1 Tax=Limnoglobus roseus TaxID=2598579 RepID=A0A5C1AH89_9BACT|nr:PEP-CTERM sorting domain-containing protein [Limnoglobus roseus]QEL17995.1 PEP-CTERM sorting domain-containing protein [Limnoglobus roseus]
MIRLSRAILLAAVCALGLLGSTTARAGLLPVNVSVNPEGDNYRWTYNIVLPTDSQLRSGDYFTIYDFGGLVSTSNVQPDNWTFSTSQTGPVPDGVNPTDRADLPNLTWKYTGPTIGSGQTGLGNFWAVSLYQESTDSFFTATTHRTTDGKVDNNITDTTVPVPVATPGEPNLVPEPATLLMAGLGLPLIGLARLTRRKVAV